MVDTDKSEDQLSSSVSNPKLVKRRRELIVRSAIAQFSAKGYYKTTIQDIARDAGFSQGFIYQYFKDKEELLFFALQVVLRKYLEEIPRRIATTRHPLDRLRATITSYCQVNDEARDATVLAYRSSRSLPKDKRKVLQELEEETNLFFHAPLNDAIESGLIIDLNTDLMVYQYIHFCHGWALKYWHFGGRYSLDEYINGGLQILVRPFLTDEGRAYWDKYHT